MAPSHYLNQSVARSCGIPLGAISHEMLKLSILDMDLNIIILRLQPYLPRDQWVNRHLKERQWPTYDGLVQDCSISFANPKPSPCSHCQLKPSKWPSRASADMIQVLCIISMIWYNMASKHLYDKIDGLVQDCSNSNALAVELLQSCTNSSPFIVTL